MPLLPSQAGKSVAIAAAFALLPACAGTDDEGTLPRGQNIDPGDGGGGPEGSQAQTLVLGAVETKAVAGDQGPLSGAGVEIVGTDQSTTTAADGTFRLNVDDVDLEQLLTVRITADNHGHATRLVRPVENGTMTMRVILKQMPPPVDVPLPAVGEAPAEVTSGAVTLQLDGGDLVAPDGTPVDGTVTVRMLTYDPAEVVSAPAAFRGIDSSGNDFGMTTFGQVRLIITEGESLLDVAPGKSVRLRSAITDQLADVAATFGPAPVMLLRLSEDGMWVPHSAATVSGNVLEAELTRLFPEAPKVARAGPAPAPANCALSDAEDRYDVSDDPACAAVLNLDAPDCVENPDPPGISYLELCIPVLNRGYCLDVSESLSAELDDSGFDLRNVVGSGCSEGECREDFSIDSTVTADICLGDEPGAPCEALAKTETETASCSPDGAACGSGGPCTAVNVEFDVDDLPCVLPGGTCGAGTVPCCFSFVCDDQVCIEPLGQR